MSGKVTITIFSKIEIGGLAAVSPLFSLALIFDLKLHDRIDQDRSLDSYELTWYHLCDRTIPYVMMHY